MTEKYFKPAHSKIMPVLFGEFDKNIRLIESELTVQIISREGVFKIIGEEENAEKAFEVLTNLETVAENSDELTEQDIRYAVAMAQDGIKYNAAELGDNYVCITASGKPIRAKTVGQKKYIELIRENTVVFGIGPAGTGKTYLAVAMAVDAFRKKQVSRIVLTRPAVEAGENLGFLPGDLQNKVDPYLRPLYDALSDMLGAEGFQNARTDENVSDAYRIRLKSNYHGRYNTDRFAGWKEKRTARSRKDFARYRRAQIYPPDFKGCCASSAGSENN